MRSKTNISIKLIERIELAEDYQKYLASVIGRPIIYRDKKIKVVFKDGKERYYDEVIQNKNEPNRIELVEY